jgi:cytochrome d ubiquinol oxidase subunit II
MSIVAFLIIAFMLAMYVILDGYDLGVATLTPFVARTDRQRDAAMHSIGPFWNGNEVWLIAAGGALFALFPQAYASSFSGFYLPFIVVLWLLMFRGIALELRGHFPTELWHNFWDVCFSGSSVLLVLIFGVAIGNLVRGVPLDPQGYFQGTFAFLLNPYALLVGMFAVFVLALHGATFLRMRVEGAIGDRAFAMIPRLWIAVAIGYIAVTATTFIVRGTPSFSWVALVPLLSIGSLIALRVAASRNEEKAAFGASSAFIATLLVAAAGTIFPYLLPGFPAGHGGLSIYDASPSPAALTSALAVTVVGLVAVMIYGAAVLRKLAGKVQVPE